MATNDLSHDAVKARALSALAQPGDQSEKIGTLGTGGSAQTQFGSQSLSSPNSSLQAADKYLTSQGDSIGSIMDRYNQLRGTVQNLQETENQRLTSQYDRDIAEQRETNRNEITGALAGVAGPAVSNIVLKDLEKTAAKRISDLNAQKNELIMQNNMSAATTIANLIDKEQSLVTQARQQYFNNLLGLNTAENEAKSLALAERKFERDLITQDLSDAYTRAQTAKALTDSTAASTTNFEVGSPLFSAYTIANELLANEDLSSITGPIQGRLGGILGGEKGALKEKLNQFINTVALAARGALKGQGTITDQEQEMLKSAQTNLARTSDDKSVKAEIKKVKGIIGLQNGIPQSVTLYRNGIELGTVNTDRDGFNNAVKDGLTVVFN